MADRFPSIEDMDEGQTGGNQNNGDNDLLDGGDGTSDFLSRERAVLGDDADQFSTPQDNIPSMSVQNGDGDLLDGPQTNGATSEMNQFQSSFPPVDTRNDRMAPGGSITGGTSPRPFSPAPSTSMAPPEEEPTVVKEWRERRTMAIESREKASSGRKEETVKAAQEAIDEFYDNYNNKREKQLGQTRKEAEEFLAKREDTSAGGTSWERIAKLIDVRGAGGKGGAAGKEKFRELLVGLMKDENAPGAKGY